MIKDIFWGIASICVSNFETYIKIENENNKFKKFNYFIQENNFFIRSNFTNTNELVSYQYKHNMSDYNYDLKPFAPKVEIINNNNCFIFFSDTFGIHSFYWFQLHNTIIFSNSSYFLAKMLKKKPLGIEGLFMHLILRGQANYSSYYEDIFQIPPQCIMKFDNLGIQISKRIINHTSKIVLPNLLLKDIPDKAIINSGISFSGGIDSSIIVWEFDSKYKNAACYSLINSNNSNLKKDLHFAKLLAKQMNLTIKNVPFELYEEVFYYDMPILDHDVYGQYCLAKYMRCDGKEFMISGSGADEIFGGYDQIFYYASRFKNMCHEEQLKCILQRYSYTSFELLKKINKDLFVEIYNNIKLYYSEISKLGENPVSKLHYWFIYHHLFWILKMYPKNIKCLFPFLREEFLSFCLQKDYEEVFPYIKCKQPDLSYHLKVKNILKEQYKDVLPLEILTRQKIPFSVQEKEIDNWYKLQYKKNKPDYLIPNNHFEEIMSGNYGNQTKLLFLSYILWRQRVL